VATTTGVFLYFLKIGALLFGSGYVFAGGLREDLVLEDALAERTQLLDGIAVSQATPDHFLRWRHFWDTCFGVEGRGLATLECLFRHLRMWRWTASVLPRLRKSPTAGIFLDGVNAAAVAADGVCGISVCARGGDDAAGGGDCGSQRGFDFFVQSQFRSGSFARAVGLIVRFAAHT